MRLRSIASIVALIASSASVAGATTFYLVDTATSSGAPLDQLAVGDTVTIGFRVQEMVDVDGFGASVFGYDESVADFQTGEAVGSINPDLCILNVGCFGGLYNQEGGQLSETSIGQNGSRVQFFAGSGICEGCSTNPLDPGLDGVVGGNGSQFRVTFVAIGLGTTVLRIGTGYLGDGVRHNDAQLPIEQATELDVTLTVIPEPTTALMIVTGLGGLAATRGGRRCPTGDMRAVSELRTPPREESSPTLDRRAG